MGIFLRSGPGWGPVTGVAAGGPQLRRSEDAIWPPVSRMPGNPYAAAFDWAARWMGVLSRLAVPVGLLGVLLGTIYLYSDAALAAQAVASLLPNPVFTVGDFIVPLAFFSIQLTGRRHGPAYAMAQLLAALGLCVAVVLADPPVMRAWIVTLPAVTGRAAIAFGIAFLFANFVGIAFFESARGPQWWTAPLIGALATALVFCGIFYPLAFAGVDGHWAASAGMHVLQLGAESVLLLIPYWLLRSAIPPLAGLNGY